jgi:hypothetical protein
MDFTMSNTLTREKKRKLQEKDKGIIDFVKIQNHMFPDLIKRLGTVLDPRHQSYIIYDTDTLLYLVILKNIFSLHTMREMNDWFYDGNCHTNLEKLTGKKLPDIPHYDTINDFLEVLSPDELDEIRVEMIRQLIRSKSFYPAKLSGGQWILIMDGTGLHHFEERHCESCLVREIIDKEGKKKKVYSHHVLEAKLVLADNIIISLGTEFIENEKEDISKQDCEINAAKRLMERIKKSFPRLKICILGDSLYAVKPIIDICSGYGWNYLFNCKDGRQKNLIQDYVYILESGEYGEKKNLLGDEKGLAKYVNHVEELTGKDFIANIFEYEYTKKIKDKDTLVRFQWLTDLELNNKNIEEMVRTGRKRWKIENEGFNSQKKGIYRIEHLNSHNPNAMKNHYLLTQIADILMQLYLAGHKILKMLKQAIKNTSSRLLETFRIATVSDEDVKYIEKYTTVHFT